MEKVHLRGGWKGNSPLFTFFKAIIMSSNTQLALGPCPGDKADRQVKYGHVTDSDVLPIALICPSGGAIKFKGLAKSG